MMVFEQSGKDTHSTNCSCDGCKMKGVCKLEEFITYNLDTIQIPDGLRITCEYYTGKGYVNRDY